MRILFVVALLLLAGCTAPEEDQPDLFGACPQWIGGPGSMEATLAINGSHVVPVNVTHDGASAATYQGHPLDMILLNTDAVGTIRLVATTATGERILLKGEDGDSLPSIMLDGAQEFRLFLTDVSHGADPAAGMPTLQFEGEGEVDVTIAPFYRVCGVLSE